MRGEKVMVTVLESYLRLSRALRLGFGDLPTVPLANNHTLHRLATLEPFVVAQES